MGNSNASLIGARVTVNDGAQQWIQTVDGGSGRGGQCSNELHFGLGDATGTVDVILDWPGSNPPNPITYSSLAINTVHAIADTARPLLIVESLEFLPEPSPAGADWLFEWKTAERGSVGFDKVEIDFGDIINRRYRMGRNPSPESAKPLVRNGRNTQTD